MIAYAFCGSFCTLSHSLAALRRLLADGFDVLPIMSEAVLGKKTSEAQRMTLAFSKMTLGEELNPQEQDLLGDATLLSGVAQFPARIKCATMAWKAIYQLVEECQEDKHE